MITSAHGDPPLPALTPDVRACRVAEPEGRCIRGCQLQPSPDQWAFPALDCADVPPPRPTPTWGQLLPRDTLLALWGLKKGECGGGELLLVSHSDMVEPGKGLLSAPQPLPWQAGKLEFLTAQGLAHGPGEANTGLENQKSLTCSSLAY